MKTFILSTILFLTASFAHSQVTVNKAPFVVKGLTYIKPTVTVVNNVPNLSLNFNEMGLPVSTAQKAALDLKADKTALSLKANSIDVTNGLNLKADKITVSNQLDTKVDKTVINSLLQSKADRSYVDFMFGAINKMIVSRLSETRLVLDTASMNKVDTIGIKLNSLYTLYNSLPGLTFTGFTKGSDTLNIVNGPLQVLQAQRVAMQDVKPWTFVIQTDQADAGEWVYVPVTGWKKIF